MSVLIDLVVIGIIAICIFLGYKKGLIGVLFTILSFLIALIIAFVLYKPISNAIIANTQIDETIQNAIMEKVLKNKTEENITPEQANNTSQIVIDYINSYTSEIKNTGTEIVAKNLAQTTIGIVVFILLLIVSRIILYFFKAIFNIIAKIPIIKQVNKLGGIVYGVIKGLLIIYIILAITSLLAPMLSDLEIFKAVNNSFIAGYMYNNNLILKIIF